MGAYRPTRAVNSVDRRFRPQFWTFGYPALRLGPAGRDLATIPVVDAENEALQMFELNQSSRAAVEKAKTQAQARRERERAA